MIEPIVNPVRETTFFRLLKTPIEEKGVTLVDWIGLFNAYGQSSETYVTDASKFVKVPGSPFAYWSPTSITQLFETYDVFASDSRVATKGLATTDDFQFLRLFWEVRPEKRDWVPFAKGGSLSPYVSEIPLEAV